MDSSLQKGMLSKIRSFTDFGAELYQPETGIPVPPAVIQIIDEEIISRVRSDQPPAVVLLYLDKERNVRGRNGNLLFSSLDDLLADICETVIPAFYFHTQEVYIAMQDYLKTREIRDAFVIAPWNHGEWIRATAEAFPDIRGVVDFSGYAAGQEPGQSIDLAEIMKITNRSSAKIALLHPQTADGGNLRWLQNRLITVWTDTPAENLSIQNQIIQGTNGILTSDSKAVLTRIEAFDQRTLVRPPVIIGHRGMPGDSVENTLRSAIAAYEAGAEAIECDVYITTDDVVVIHHDGDTGDIYTENLEIEKSSWEQLRALTIKPSLKPEPEEHMATLEAYFAYFKDKPMVHFIEVKSRKPRILMKIKELAEQYGVADQCVIISFFQTILSELRHNWPEVSCGLLEYFFLIGNASKAVRGLCRKLQSLNAAYAPSFSDTRGFRELLKLTGIRGITFWTWTVDGEKELDAAIAAGIQGIITNDTWRLSREPMALRSSDAVIRLKERFFPKAELLARDGTVRVVTPQEILLEHGGEWKTVESGYLPQSPGKIAFIIAYKGTFRNGEAYMLYSRPYKLEVKG